MGGDVVCLGCHFWDWERAEPNARFFAGFSDFGHPFAPPSLTDAAVHGVSCAAALALRRGGASGGGGGGGGSRGGGGGVIFGVW